MSGHSKWHNIRLRKGAQDAKRSNLFTKLAKEISIAAKSGGGDPDANPRLRLAITKAREQSMPQDNIKRAIQRGTGEIAGEAIEELTYEGYGPGGVAVIVECATDNKNRTVGNIRSIFNKLGGRMGESGSVSYRFRPVGRITVKKKDVDEESIFTAAIEAGAEDVRTEDEEFYEIITGREDFNTVRQGLEDAKISLADAALTMEPLDTVSVDPKEQSTLMKMLDALEDDDDVQNVHVNAEFADEALATAR